MSIGERENMCVFMRPPLIISLIYYFSVVCDLKTKCEELQKFIQISAPDAKVNCIKGPQGAFEIKINDQLIYSKIRHKTYPEFDDVAENVVNVAQNKPMKKVRPTKDECTIM